jgi:hypothetical protein
MSNVHVRALLHIYIFICIYISNNSFWSHKTCLEAILNLLSIRGDIQSGNFDKLIPSLSMNVGVKYLALGKSSHHNF